MARVVIYTTRFCPYCLQAKQLLEGRGIDYTEIDVGADPTSRAEMTARAEGRWTVPQVFIDDAPVGGCDELYALEAEGGLDALADGTEE
jgi:glutaredoxin 3